MGATRRSYDLVEEFITVRVHRPGRADRYATAWYGPYATMGHARAAVSHFQHGWYGDHPPEVEFFRTRNDWERVED